MHIVLNMPPKDDMNMTNSFWDNFASSSAAMPPLSEEDDESLNLLSLDHNTRLHDDGCQIDQQLCPSCQLPQP